MSGLDTSQAITDNASLAEEEAHDSGRAAATGPAATPEEVTDDAADSKETSGER